MHPDSIQAVVRSLRLGAVLGALSVAPVKLLAQQDSAEARHPDHTTMAPRVVINVDSLDRAAFANVAELLQARVPGLHISRTGDGGMRWFMRGPSSVYENTPMVLIDDVRLTVAGSATRELGTRPPLLDEIDLEDVERIEVLSGPATSAQYGTGAGSGVIRIVTFAPRAQKTSFRIATATGALDENVSYPANFTRAGVDSAGAPVSRCTLRVEAAGRCTPTGPPTSINVLESQSPFETATTARVAASVASGSERFAWRGGTTFDRQASTTGALATQRLHLRGAAGFRPSRDADVRVRAHWVRADADLPSLYEPSLLHQGLLARADTVWRGFVEPHTSEYASQRYGATATARWRPRPWLDARLTSGFERMRDEDDLQFAGPSDIWYVPSALVARGERRRRDLSVRLDAEASYGADVLRHGTALTTEHAVSRQEDEFQQQADGWVPYGFWINLRTGITGVAVMQRLHLGRQALLEGGLRLDRVEQGGVRWDVPLSPHLAFTWDARLPSPAPLGGVRLRARLGDAPNVSQTTRFFFLGSPAEPKAEVTREREVGVDVTGAGDRVDLSVTWYVKRTSDVTSVAQGPQPAPGFILAQFEVLNRGIETSLRARLVQTRRVTWDARAWYAYNHNEMTQGGPPHLLAANQFGHPGSQAVMAGRPLGAHRIIPTRSIRDLDGDGLVDNICFEGGGTCEVMLGSSQFRPAFPPRSASLETSVRFGALTASALVDHRSGHVMQNVIMEQRCFTQCQALYDPSSTFEERAEASLAAAGVVENAGYTKLREVSLRISAPASWASALGGSRLDISLAGRNVATWTDYSGLDPESTSNAWIPLAQVDYAAVPLPRRFLVRVDLHGR